MTPDELHARRCQADSWLEYACDYVRGRTVADPVAKLISEGRGAAERYSSCGDLPHWMLYRCGVRLPWINRTENGGWHMGQNLTHLFWAPAPARGGSSGDRFECGDVLEVWNRPDGTDAHAICVIEHDADARVLVTAEGGQKWGGERPPKHADFVLFRHQYVERNGLLWIGARAVHRWLPFNAVMLQAEAAGKLVDAETPPQLHADGSVA